VSLSVNKSIFRRSPLPRYLSVEEAAAALKTTDRTVRRMLNDGRLAGSQTEDKGKMVWRVNATKELLEQLEKLEQVHDQSLFSAEVVGSATDVTEEDKPKEEAEPGFSQNDQGSSKEDLSPAAESFWSFMEEKILTKLQEKDQAIGMLLKVIEEKDLQLKLLPDLEKQAKAAEEEKKKAEAKEQEAIKERAKSEAERERAERLAREVEEERLRAKEEKKNVELKELEIQALKKQVDVMSDLKQSTEASRLAAKEELERIKAEKEEKERAVQEEVKALARKLEELQRPWYKKWFTWRQVEEE